MALLAFRGVDFFTQVHMRNPNAERPSPLPSRGSPFENRSTESVTANLAALIAREMARLAEHIRLHGRAAQKGGNRHVA